MATETANCLRCGRKLTAKRSVAEQVGSRCKAKLRAAAKEATAARYADKPHLVARAEELIEAGGVTLVRGKACQTAGSEGALYLSHPAACNCKAGLRGKNVCHHRIAADIYTATLAA
jgi:hypothetical protein